MGPQVETMAGSEAAHGSGVGTEWGEGFSGLRRRMLFSIILPIGWLCFTLLYVAFWATGFSLFQSIVILLVSTLLLGGTMGGVWMWWGPNYAREWGRRPGA